MDHKSIATNYHSDVLRSFRSYKRMAERAIEQLDDNEFYRLIDPESNSVAMIVKHIAGNLNSRWRDFLTSDGEKPNRFRDTEFEILQNDTRDSLMKSWESGWQTLFNAVEPPTEDDLARTVTIRGEPHTVVEALNRQLTHYTYHIGQIVMLAKHLRSSKWQTLSVPRNRSEEFNRFLEEKRFGRRPQTAPIETSFEMFQQALSVYDSLTEAQMEDGDKDLAIKNYEKSLELNPQNTNATDMLKKLRENK